MAQTLLIDEITERHRSEFDAKYQRCSVAIGNPQNCPASPMVLQTLTPSILLTSGEVRKSSEGVVSSPRVPLRWFGEHLKIV